MFELWTRMLVVSAMVATSYAWGADEASTPVTSEVGRALTQGFIWASPSVDRNQRYVAFRKTFELAASPRSAAIHIFADTRYLLWVNGTFIDRGPCRFDPKRPEYDTHEITAALKTGKNSIAVLVHYYAIASFREWNQQCARMMEHRAWPHGQGGAGFAGRTANRPPDGPELDHQRSHTLPAFPRQLFVGAG